MHILKISKRFYDSLLNDESQKILRVYGFSSRDDFLSGTMAKLNSEYNFMNLGKYEFLTNEEIGIYHMYNGYVSGDFEDYDELTVSFTTISGKGGNVWFNQQVVPMITSKLQINKYFLINERIKKICVLTTHKSSSMTRDANVVEWDSTIQMNVNFARTIGFDFVDIFPLKNLNIAGRYRSVEEIIKHTDFLQATHPKNSQFKQIRQAGDNFQASFEHAPQGQEQKFFMLKILASSHLLGGHKIDISTALKQANDTTLKTLNDYLIYLESIKFQNKYMADTPEAEAATAEYIELDDPIVLASEVIRKGIPEYRQEVVTIFDSKGKRKYKTQKKFKTNSIKAQNYVCGANDDTHVYFTANTTKEPFVEGHHMIPMEYQHQYWTDKATNLDCTINIAPLCPHCHSKIHYAISEQKNEVISTLFSRYKTSLTKIDPELTLSKFASFYRVYIY